MHWGDSLQGMVTVAALVVLLVTGESEGNRKCAQTGTVLVVTRNISRVLHVLFQLVYNTEQYEVLVVYSSRT